MSETTQLIPQPAFDAVAVALEDALAHAPEEGLRYVLAIGLLTKVIFQLNDAIPDMGNILRQMAEQNGGMREKR